MPVTDEQLVTWLKRDRFLDGAELTKAKEKAEREKISVYEALLQLDLVSDENLGKLMADAMNLRSIVLSKVKIDEAVLKIIPEPVAKKAKAVSFSIDEKKLKVATLNPENEELWRMLAKKTGRTVEIYLVTSRDMEESLRLYKKDLQSVFGEWLSAVKVKTGQKGKEELPIGRMIDVIVEYGYDRKASDIHIEPGDEQAVVRFRVDGILADVLELPSQIYDQLVTRIKVLARLRTDEHMSAQDGKLQMKLAEEELDIRISIVPVVGGEKVVMRLLTAHFRSFGLADLGMSEQDLKKVTKGFEKPYGMILATGPTGSGKTTTLYAILKIINTRQKNIATIEDPVEYEIAGVNQIQVNPKTNLTFAAGLRSILRQDPDIIYVGEIRDEETADIAINSAMTGHLVLSTLHTNDAATALPRLIDQKAEPFLVASTVSVIVGQRLVRKICDKCKVSMEYHWKNESWESEGTDGNSLELLDKSLIQRHFGTGKTIRLYQGKGCPVCHQSGYVGRVGIFEVLQVTEKVQGLIRQKADSDVILKQAVSEGMTTMMADGLNKVKQGVTTIEEVLRVTRE